MIRPQFRRTLLSIHARNRGAWASSRRWTGIAGLDFQDEATDKEIGRIDAIRRRRRRDRSDRDA
jgi:hypothetical protein